MICTGRTTKSRTAAYNTRYVEQDPDRLVPVDVLRELEKTGVVGK